MTNDRTRRLLVSGEVLEEIEEILILLRQVNAEIIVAAPASIICDLSEETLARVHTVQVRDAEHGNAKAKILGIGEFLKLMRATRPDFLISGFSMLKHRLAAFVHRTPHIAYVRGLMFNAEIRSGFSDRVESSLLGRVLPRKVRQPFGADMILTVSDVNMRFLRERGIEEAKLRICGPVWLADMPATSAGQVRRVIVCTSGIAAHGYVALHEAQTEDLAGLVARLGSDSIVLRVHPRDHYDYAGDPRFQDVVLSTEKPYEFLRTLTPADVLITPPSTLAYEAGYLGIPSVLVTQRGELRSDASLAALGIRTIEFDEVPTALRGTPQPQRAFAAVAPDALRKALDDLEHS